MFITFKNNLTPAYMPYMFSARDFSHNIGNYEIILQVPKPRTVHLKRSLVYSGAVLWNGFPSELRKPLPPKTFRKGIRAGG